MSRMRGATIVVLGTLVALMSAPISSQAGPDGSARDDSADFGSTPDTRADLVPTHFMGLRCWVESYRGDSCKSTRNKVPRGTKVVLDTVLREPWPASGTGLFCVNHAEIYLRKGDRTIGPAVSTPQGYVKFPRVRVRRTTVFQAVYNGTDTCAPSVSESLRIRVG